MKNHCDGGEAILAGLRSLGVDYIISSPGSEWSPVWEALSRQKLSGTEGPGYIDCWHETLAVDMALGYAQMTGRVQAVLLHAGAGLLQGMAGMHSAVLAEVPMVVMSGESLTLGEDPQLSIEAQWYRSLSIAGGPQRLAQPVVKWASQVTSSFTLYESVIRAGEMAGRGPMGPTYLNVPLETMLQEWTPPDRLRKVPSAARPQAPAEEIAKVAALIAQARHPVIVTESAGRDPAAYAALVDLAELCAIPVVGGLLNTYANFPKDNPLSLGGGIGAFHAEADLVLLVGSRSPWYPPSRHPPNATVVAISDNPLKTYMAYQAFQADSYLEGDIAASLRGLVEAIGPAGMKSAMLDDRRARCSREHAALQARLRAAEAAALSEAPVSPVALVAALRQALPPDAIYVDETITHAPLVPAHLSWNRPQSYFRVGLRGVGAGHGRRAGREARRAATTGRPSGRRRLLFVQPGHSGTRRLEIGRVAAADRGLQQPQICGDAGRPR